jgi:hypothetical protein
MPTHIIRKCCTCEECVEKHSSGVLMEARLIPAHLHRVKSMCTTLPQSSTTPACKNTPSDADGLAAHLLALMLTDNGPDLNSQVNKLWDSRASFQAAGPSRCVIDGTLKPISMSDIAGSINRLVLQNISSPNTLADLARDSIANTSVDDSVTINFPISHTQSHTLSPLPAQLGFRKISKKDHHRHTREALKILSNVESHIQRCHRLLLDSSNGTFTTISEDLAKLHKADENVRCQSDLVISKKCAITSSLDELEIELRSVRQSDGDHHTPVEFVVGGFHSSFVCESKLTSLVVNQDQSPICCMDIIAQVVVLICVVCHVMFGVDTRSSSFIMGAISLLLYLAFQTSKGTPSLSQENIL